MTNQASWLEELGVPPLVAGALEVVAIVVVIGGALWLVRGGVLRWKARSPRVQLSSVTRADIAASGAKVDKDWVLSMLREQLSALQLSATEALPEAASGSPLVEIVEGVGEGVGDKSQLGRALGRLARAIVPEAAYEVSATLRPASGGGGVISVQVVDRTHRSRTVIRAVENISWEKCAKAAAAEIAGSLYPRVADRHKGPWTRWKNPVPGELVTMHEEALQHEECDRLEQALGVLHTALDQDPLNPHLRLRIAMLQERLKLDLGAWATYRAIADETQRDCWKGADRRVRLLALYRLAILLGNQRVAKRVVSPGDDESQRRHLEELRDGITVDHHLVRTSWWSRVPALSMFFPARFSATSPARLLDELGRPTGRSDRGVTPTPTARRRRGKWLATELCWKKDVESEDQAVTRIADLLQVISLARLEQLDARLRRRPPLRPWRWKDWWRYRQRLRSCFDPREFSLSAIRISKLIARLRIVAGARRRHADDEPRMARAVRAHYRLLRRWPFPPTRRRLPARLLRPRHRLADRRDDAWQYHYNAACAVSMVLPTNPEMTGAGIKQLEEYAHRAGSAKVRAQTDWIGREDDDLTELRDTDEYARWARHHLPEKATDVEAPSGDPEQIDTARIAARIAYGGACAFAACWLSRSERNAGVEETAIWWREEATAWEALAQIFAEHQNWRKRWQGIDALQACLRAGGEPELIDAAHRPEDHTASIELSTQLVDALKRLAPSPLRPQSEETPLGSWIRKRAERAHAMHERAGVIGHPRLRALRERREAARAHRIWKRLADALEEELTNQSHNGAALQQCLVEIQSEIS